MRHFPQEIVDAVIDELALFDQDEDIDEELGIAPPLAHETVANYSTVSRDWINRTQFHHFNRVQFLGDAYLEKWRTAIDPKSRVSKHVRLLYWQGISTLKGFECHLSAFTGVRETIFDFCNIFCSLDEVELLGWLKSNLVEVHIERSTFLPGPMARLLSLLPQLRRFYMDNLIPVNPLPAPEEPLPSIPFFRGANELCLLFEEYPPHALDWIPPTAQFSKLEVGASCLKDYHGVVNGWLTSSGENLDHLYLIPDSRMDASDSTLCNLDLSRCTSLELLHLPVPADPTIFTLTTLTSISSSELHDIYLVLDTAEERVDPRHWKMLDNVLCQLAKRFTTHYGGKFSVDIQITRNPPLFAQFQNEKLLSDLDKEADMKLFHHQ